jgi:type I restriction enzyme S subunit
MPNIGFKATLGPNMFFLKLKNNYCIESYMYYLLNAPVYFNTLQMIASATAQPKLNKDNIRCLRILFPNSINEQKQIAAYLDTKCSDIDRLISLKQEKIEYLKAYKQSIIYEYVTGKVSVRC